MKWIFWRSEVQWVLWRSEASKTDGKSWRIVANFLSQTKVFQVQIWGKMWNDELGLKTELVCQSLKRFDPAKLRGNLVQFHGIFSVFALEIKVVDTKHQQFLTFKAHICYRSRILRKESLMVAMNSTLASGQASEPQPLLANPGRGSWPLSALCLSKVYIFFWSNTSRRTLCHKITRKLFFVAVSKWLDKTILLYGQPSRMAFHELWYHPLSPPPPEILHQYSSVAV